MLANGEETGPAKSERPSKGSKEALVEAVSTIPGLGPAKAEALYEHGIQTLDHLQALSLEELGAIEGFGAKLAEKVYEHLQSAPPAEVVEVEPTPAAAGEGDEALKKWLTGEEGNFESWLDSEGPESPRETEAGEGDAPAETAAKTSPLAAPKAGRSSGRGTAALERWLKGEEEDFEAWLTEPDADGVPEPTSERDSKGEPELGEDLEALRGEVVQLKRALKEELGNVQAGSFDPVRYLEEIAKLNRQLRQEKKRRKGTESELDHMKKSSVAVIKYVKSQKGEEGPEAQRKLAEERESRQKLKAEVTKLQSLLQAAQTELQAGLKDLPADQKSLKEAQIQLQEREAEIAAREEELTAASAQAADAALEQRLQAELAEKERLYLDKEAETQKRIIELEGEVDRLKIDAKLRTEAFELSAKPEQEINDELAKKADELQRKERELLLRTEEVEKAKEELAYKDQEIEKLKEPLAYKEEEMLRREEDLIYREKLLEAEKRRVEEAKAQAGSVEELALKERLESLKSDISTKEEEVRTKEKYLAAKMEELRLREQGLIEDEIDAREEERRLEMHQEKAKTGTPRMDDLLLGGMPFGSNVSIYGPPFIGKEVLVSAFIAEGLKKGLPALWVITDKTPADVREEMEYVIPGYEEYERLGLVRYVDAYSRGMGASEEATNVTYIDDPTDHVAILAAVDSIAKEMKAKHPYYRLAFRSISTLIAYLDSNTAFRFLQPFAGRRKRDKAISAYLIEKGMHGEQEIQLLGSVMDGMVEFKVEQLKTFLSVKGICDVQSRAWIQYMYSKQGVSIGSFSLDHIK